MADKNIPISLNSNNINPLYVSPDSEINWQSCDLNVHHTLSPKQSNSKKISSLGEAKPLTKQGEEEARILIEQADQLIQFASDLAKGKTRHIKDFFHNESAVTAQILIDLAKNEHVVAELHEDLGNSINRVVGHYVSKASSVVDDGIDLGDFAGFSAANSPSVQRLSQQLHLLKSLHRFTGTAGGYALFMLRGQQLDYSSRVLKALKKENKKNSNPTLEAIIKEWAKDLDVEKALFKDEAREQLISTGISSVTALKSINDTFRVCGGILKSGLSVLSTVTSLASSAWDLYNTVTSYQNLQEWSSEFTSQGGSFEDVQALREKRKLKAAAKQKLNESHLLDEALQTALNLEEGLKNLRDLGVRLEDIKGGGEFLEEVTLLSVDDLEEFFEDASVRRQALFQREEFLDAKRDVDSLWRAVDYKGLSIQEKAKAFAEKGVDLASLGINSDDKLHHAWEDAEQRSKMVEQCRLHKSSRQALTKSALKMLVEQHQDYHTDNKHAEAVGAAIGMGMSLLGLGSSLTLGGLVMLGFLSPTSAVLLVPGVVLTGAASLMGVYALYKEISGSPHQYVSTFRGDKVSLMKQKLVLHYQALRLNRAKRLHMESQAKLRGISAAQKELEGLLEQVNWVPADPCDDEVLERYKEMQLKIVGKFGSIEAAQEKLTEIKDLLANEREKARVERIHSQARWVERYNLHRQQEARVEEARRLVELAAIKDFLRNVNKRWDKPAWHGLVPSWISNVSEKDDLYFDAQLEAIAKALAEDPRFIDSESKKILANRMGIDLDSLHRKGGNVEARIQRALRGFFACDADSLEDMLNQREIRQQVEVLHDPLKKAI